MHWLLFIHKIIFSSTCFEPQMLIFRRIQLYSCSIRYTAWVLTQDVYRQATRNSHREWQYHRLHEYNCILLKMSTWGSKHVEENSILWINNNQCIKLVFNIYFFYVVQHLDSTASYLPTGLHLGFFRSWPSLVLPPSFSSFFLVLCFVLASTSMLFWAIFLLPFLEHGRTMLAGSVQSIL